MLVKVIITKLFQKKVWLLQPSLVKEQGFLRVSKEKNRSNFLNSTSLQGFTETVCKYVSIDHCGVLSK